MRKLEGYILIVIGILFLQGCIKNDLPYPIIQQNITSLEAVGEIRGATIDSTEVKVG